MQTLNCNNPPPPPHREGVNSDEMVSFAANGNDNGVIGVDNDKSIS